MSRIIFDKNASIGQKALILADKINTEKITLEEALLYRVPLSVIEDAKRIWVDYPNAGRVFLKKGYTQCPKVGRADTLNQLLSLIAEYKGIDVPRANKDMELKDNHK